MKPAADNAGAGKTILVDPGVFHTLNIGDTAMLAACTRRLHELLPGARILVFTDAPERLRRLCPEAEPVPAEARRDWFHDWAFLGKARIGCAPASARPAGRRSTTRFATAREWAGG